MALHDDAQRIRAAARDLAELGQVVGAELDARLVPDVAQPVADAVRRSWAGPWARPLAGATSVARDGAAALVVVGGGARVVSGGGTATQLAYGSLGGGSGRSVPVSRRTRRGSSRYQLRAGVQFDRHNRDTLTPALESAGDLIDAATLQIIDDALEKVT